MPRKRIFYLLGLFFIVIVIPALMVKGIYIFSEEEVMVVDVYNHVNDKITSMEMNTYLTGVVAAEMPAAYEFEALKAQAVAARTYTILKMKNRDERHPEADICTDFNHCQAWLSEDEMKERWGSDYFYYFSRISYAVRETRGEVIVHNGRPVDAVYHSNSGGITESAKNVWGNDIPYLTSVDSPYDHERTGNYQHNIYFKVEDFERQLGIEIKSDFYEPIDKSESGRVRELKLGDRYFSGREIRNLLNLPSTRFDFAWDGARVICRVVGNGHGVGMSQDGADGMARRGLDYIEILKHYYNDVKIIQW